MIKQALTHPIILGSVGVVLLIAIGSGVYYYEGSKPPAAITTIATTTADTVTGTGTVEPSENPDLAFQSAGRIVRIAVNVGDTVSAGQTLATLDLAAQAAQRAQAAATFASQQAKLDEMNAGPRAVDVAAKQTALDQANAALANLYATIPSDIAQAYDKASGGVVSYTDALFNAPNLSNPTLIFTTGDYSLGIAASDSRSTVNGELAAWQSEINALGTDTGAIDQELTASIAHLRAVRTYADALRKALGSAVATPSFTTATIAADQVTIGTLSDTVNVQILALQGLQQAVTNDVLAIKAAQDALAQVQAGSTAEAIRSQQAQVDAARAAVALIDAQLQNGTITAPFSGVVSSVHEKVGEIISANTPVISLSPKSALQVNAYLTELDVGKIAVGDTADVTLDAYGTTKHWTATIVSVDHSPSVVNGVTGYKTTLQFTAPDPSISSGMTANITIPVHQ